ncbi:protein ABHD13-like isoform X2 [Ornithodoros turicata]|uniref:protein ABHD13-like isoform X2 n=1 Tax=Ornithodoros turicata TaxID=34597 RepID=UPI003138EFCF
MNAARKTVCPGYTTDHAILTWLKSSALYNIKFAGLVYQLGDLLLFHPNQPPHSRLYVPSPTMLGLPTENLRLKAHDGVSLHAFFIKQEPPLFSQAITLLYFHGNAGNIGHRLLNVEGLFHNCGCNILLLEYRGYGRSEGSPSEEGLYLDAEAGLHYLLQHPGIDHSLIILFGRSLGGAVALDLASRPEHGSRLFGVVVENTFTSIPDMARALLRWKVLQWLPEFCYKNQFQSIQKVPKMKTPTLFVSGLSDALTPPSMMQRLYKDCSSAVKRMVTFESGTHNETWQCKGYYNSLNMFFHDLVHRRFRDKEGPTWPVEHACIRIPPETI